MESITWDFYFLCGKGARPLSCMPDTCIKLVALIASLGDQVCFKEMGMGAMLTRVDL